MKANRSNVEPPRGETFQRLHGERQASKIASNRAIAAAHGREQGPRFTATTEVQPQPKRPRLQVR